MPESFRFPSRWCFFALPLAIGVGLAAAQQPKPDGVQPGATPPAAKSDASAAEKSAPPEKSPGAPSDSTAASGKPVEPSPEKAEKPAPKPGPKIFNLRYNEDFSYLDGEPGSYTPDFFDPIKNIHLGPDWRLSIGGELRVRMESETNKTFGAARITTDTFFLHRYLMHADLKYGKGFRVFAQFIAALDDNRDLPPRPGDENRMDLNQLFFDVRFLGEDVPWTLRVGRQELEYGNFRRVAVPDFANTRRRFDGVKVFTRQESWDLDFFYTKPVLIQPDQRDRFDEKNDFYGLYFTWRGIPRHGIDVYVFAVDNTDVPRNPNGRAGDKSAFTFGSRFWGKTPPWDYETEAAYQWGGWANADISAWNWSADGGYTFGETPWKPRIGAGIDWASGDKNPFDRKVETFDSLFQAGHKYFGYIDLIGRQNVLDIYANVMTTPITDKVKTETWYHCFWLDSDTDALYNVAGVPGRRDRSGHSGTELGQELDITVTWTLDVHSSILIGYSHFWDGTFIRRTGPDQDVDFYYAQYALKF